MTSSSPLLILVVSGSEVVRQQLVHDIAHRFGADYTVTAAATTDVAGSHAFLGVFRGRHRPLSLRPELVERAR